VTCALFDYLKTTIVDTGSDVEVGLMLEGLQREHYSCPVWIEQALGQGAVKHTPIGRI